MENERENAAALAGDEATLRRAFHDIWSAAALAVIAQRSGEGGWSAREEAGEPPAALPVEVAAHWELRGALAGKLQIKLHRAAALAWARLGAEGAGEGAEELNAADTGTIAAVMRELAEQVAQGLAAGGWGKVEIDCRHVGPLRRNLEGADGEFPMRFQHAAGRELELDLCLDSSLREQIRLGPRFEPGGETQSAAPVGGSARLDLLLDVELQVTLRFGGRQMLLHDVLELAPGSVLELDRHIDDPVELLVGGKIIAWGEVVVVDGNYGLRITRLVHRRDRMAAVGAAR